MTAIRELTMSLRNRIKSQWIKGHQDDRTPYENLSRDAKLNVDADNLATQHQAGKRFLPKEAIPHLQEQRVTVVINGQRYPSQVYEQIRYHINGSNLKHYLTNKWSWSEGTWTKIDIHNFGIHFKRLPTAQKTQHMKYIYDLQATGRRKGQQSNTADGPVTRCPCCRTTVETQFHMIHCRQNPKREESLQEFYKEIRRSGGKQFGRIIADSFERWFDDPTSIPTMENICDPQADHDTLYSDPFKKHIQTALKHQEEIGWMHATRGFLAKSWHMVACTQIEIPSEYGVQHTHRDDGQQRTYQVVRALHNLVSKIWKGRNDELHRRDQENEVVHRTAIDAEIARLHKDPQELLAADHHYCHHPLDSILRKPPTYKRRWLHRVRESIARKTADQNRQNRITKFFTRESTPKAPLAESASATHPQTAAHPRRKIQTTQQLLTDFFRERAPNLTTIQNLSTSPPP